MHCLINSTQSKEFAQSHTVLVLSPFCSKPDHMGERSGLARTDRLRACLSAKSAPHSLTGCSAAITGKDDCLGQDEQSKPRRLVSPSSKQKRESKGRAQWAREEKQVTAQGVSQH